MCEVVDHKGRTEKKCTQCLEIKSVTEFAYAKKSENFRTTMCKLCSVQYRIDQAAGLTKKPPFIVDNKKICSLCKKYLPFKSFQKNTKVSSGLRSSCIECNKKPIVEKYIDPEGYKTCVCCGLIQTVDQFPNRSKSTGLLLSPCRLCKNKKQREFSKDNIHVKIRNRIAVAINTSKKKDAKIIKSGSSVELLGCSMEKFIKHMSSMFVDGMSWENHGEVWHIDHIIPICKFDLSKKKNQKLAFNYKNCQPMFKSENLVKNSKILDEHKHLALRYKIMV